MLALNPDTNLLFQAQFGSLSGVGKIQRKASTPPYNPKLRDLIEAKDHWSAKPDREEIKKGFRGWNERGYLPHRDKAGLTQFVTFRLKDSFPAALRAEWEHLLEIKHVRERQKKLELYLDKGMGICHLQRPEIAAMVQENFLKFNGDRYQLFAWVIMPNHVHVLFKPGLAPMAEIVGAWKKHTGRIGNRLLRLTGKFWAEDYFDVFIRNADHRRRAVRYIENNPSKAKLVIDPKSWLWSSTKFRDDFGNLVI